MFSRFSVLLLLTAVGIVSAADPIRETAVPVGRPPNEHPDALALIQAAGNATDELLRLQHLRLLVARPDLGAGLRGELRDLLPVVEAWADGRSQATNDDRQAAENGYLCNFITSRVRPSSAGEVYPSEPARNSPLHAIWALYRGRMLIWRPVESSPLLRVQEIREAYYGEGRRLLEEAQAAFPANRTIGIYLGRAIPWPHRSQKGDDHAPQWANLQREGLERLADIVHWWIKERQLPDGQFGGGWGDDVEMWRNWVPVLIAFEDPVIIAAQERLSNGLFARPHLSAGFTSRMTDVEHSNEDTTDTILPIMHLKPDDPVWQQRALRLAELMETRWTGVNARGQFQFKSIYFNVDQVDESPRRAFDTVYHAAIVQPTLLYWQRTGSARLTALFDRWLQTWIEAAARSENGKPAGILPSTIAWPSGELGVVVAGGKGWWEPFPLNHNDALYNWPGVTHLMSSTLLLAWHMTGDEKYLTPLRTMAAFARQHAGDAPEIPGSDGWAARQVLKILGDTLAKYRLLSGDPQYDDLLGESATAYGKFRLDGRRGELVAGLEKNAKAFRANWETYTSEMRWTDRVFLFNEFYLRYQVGLAAPGPELQTLYSSVTGDPGTPLIFPLNAVRWRTPPRDFAALVTGSGPKSFSAELYHFGNEPRSFVAELLLLQPGDYEVELFSPEDPAVVERRRFSVHSPRVEVPVTLPSRQLMQMNIHVASKVTAADH